MDGTYFFYVLLRRLPVLLLLLAGILFAIIRWKRHPKVSVLTVLGLGLFLLQSLAFTFVYFFLPRLQERAGWSPRNTNNLYTVVEVCQDMFYSIVIVLLVGAAFSQRKPQTSDSRTEPITPT